MKTPPTGLPPQSMLLSHPRRLTLTQKAEFRDVVQAGYRAHGRTMPWRERTDVYAVLVSEMMLQQTQVARVIPKFHVFMTALPTINALAAASLGDILRLWNGLGYNRRAKYLQQAAQMVVASGGDFPRTVTDLIALPGIGLNTAGAIMNYAYNRPTVFVETNIRTVYLHHFFANDSRLVHDQEVRDLVAQTLDRKSPREWFWALMDYGAHLKATRGGRLDQSSHYRRQSPLVGSSREMRGRIVRALTVRSLDSEMLARTVDADQRFEPALAALESEGLVSRRDTQWSLTGYPQAS